jgi:hypothetical protein
MLLTGCRQNSVMKLEAFPWRDLANLPASTTSTVTFIGWYVILYVAIDAGLLPVDGDILYLYLVWRDAPADGAVVPVLFVPCHRSTLRSPGQYTELLHEPHEVQ